jgi:hypothetical protein
MHWTEFKFCFSVVAATLIHFPAPVIYITLAGVIALSMAAIPRVVKEL